MTPVDSSEVEDRDRLRAGVAERQHRATIALLPTAVAVYSFVALIYLVAAPVEPHLVFATTSSVAAAGLLALWAFESRAGELYSAWTTCAASLLVVAVALGFVAVTANALDSDRESCVAAGMDDFVVKPLGADTLAEALLRAPAASPSGEVRPSRIA